MLSSMEGYSRKQLSSQVPEHESMTSSAISASVESAFTRKSGKPGV